MLVGRRVELSAVERVLDGALAGKGGSVLLRGEPGIGKTALLGAAARDAGPPRVLVARGVESEAELPFAGLLDLVRPILAFRTRLPELQSAALAGAVALGPPAPGDRFAVCAAAHALVAIAAAEQPRALLVDDLQWLDAPSRECVLYLAHRLPPRVALVAAWRDEPPHDPVPQLPALRLPRLDDRDATALLQERAAELAPEVAARLVSAAAGVPLALVELLEGLSPGQRAGTEPVEALPDVGPGLRRAFTRRLDALSPGARSALVILAAHGAGELAPVVRALAHLGLDPELLEEAEAVGLLRLADARAELVHPLAGSVAYREATPRERRRAHRALAAVLEGERAAWHLAAAATAPSEDVARALERTASEARGRRAHATAAAALERAARLSAEDAPRARRLLAAAREAASAGRTQSARRLLVEVEALETDPVTRLQCADLRGFLETWDGDVLDGGELLARAALEHAAGDPIAGAALLSDAAMVATVAGDCRLALERAQAAAALLPPDGRPAAAPTRARVLAVLSWAFVLRADGGRARRLIDTVEPQLGDFDPLSPEAQFLLIALNVRSPSEDYERARAHALAIVAAARDAGALAALPIALSIAADAGQRLGRWEAARADLAEIVELSDSTGQRMPLVHALGVRARLEAATGHDDAARAAVDRAVAVGLPSRIGSMLMFATAGLGFLELGRGDVEAALPPLERCERMADFSGMDDPLLIPWAPDLVEALARADRIADARRVTRRLARTAHSSGTATAAALAARCRGVVSGGAADAAFAEALGHHGRARMPFERARTQLAYGAKLHRARRVGDARRQLRAALEGFERLGAAPWAEQARAELSAAGGRRRARREGLTPAELRVARAVARGATNREAASELFLSPKTVDFHLRNVFRKLSVRNRTELALALRRAEEPDPRPHRP